MDEIDQQQAPPDDDVDTPGSGRVPPWRSPDPAPPLGATWGPPRPAAPPTGPSPSSRSSRGRRTALLAVVLVIAAVMAMFALSVVLLSQPSPVATEVDAMNGTGTWVIYRDPAGAFELEFPAEPEPSAEEVTADYRAVEITARVLRDTFTLERIDFTDGATGGVLVEAWLDEMPGRAADASGSTLRVAQRTTHAGLNGVEYVLERPDSTTRVTALLSGRRLFRFSVTAPTNPGAGFDRFVDSFVPVDPLTGERIVDDP